MPAAFSRNRTIAGAIVIALVVIAAIFLTGGKPDATLVGQDVRVTRIVRGAEITDAAYVSVPFTREAEYPYANVAIDLNGDGAFAAYALADGAMQEEWVVRNMRALVIEAGNSWSFVLADTAAHDRKDIPLSIQLTEKPIDDWSGKPHRRGAGNTLTIAEIGVEDFGGLIAPGNPQGTGAGEGSPKADGKLKSDSRPSAKPWLEDVTAAPQQGLGTGEAAAIGATVSTPSGAAPAGFDYEVFQSNVPDVPQDINECVPTSTSNALHWLGDTYGFTDKLPKTQLETIEELKKDLKWTRKDGVYVEPDFLTGKVAFTQRHNLPIVTHQVGGKFDPDIAKKVGEELAKGQAVEIVIGYYEQNAAGEWIRNGGHMMSAVGAFGMGGKSYLGFHDPASPDTGRLDIYNVQGSRIMDYRYRGRFAVFIEYAIAESPTEAWLKEHPPKIAIRTGGAIGEVSDMQDVWTVDMIQIGTAWFPVVQFHKFTGPECDRAEHWHANAGTAWGLEFGRNGEFYDLTPQHVLSRAAPTISWTDPGNCGAGKTAAVKRFNIMVSADEAGRIAGQLLTQ